ncbi:cell division cycle 45 [Hibiscus trionum]|uniref:Cell division cycle 45 n=1 Tax=Hibiscus trionum TaxID=183268 RepID=A0A9W7LHD5_HIBTR|nr:cell division cycle 45 [Hibiscus trionum]GMI64099.1 cell division cycle 45 [Hibiscus trionum]
MQQAIKIQRAILRQGSAAITKSGCIRSGRKFRWVKLEDSIDTKLLGHPQALIKFCYFLMDALKEKGAKLKPLLCACILQEPSKVLIVGVCGKPRLGALKGNAFGLAFRHAAEETGAEFFHELFESSWIVLDAGVVNSFMVELTEKL